MPTHSRKFVVKRASYSTKQRMKEIQFWFIMKVIMQKHKKRLVIAKDFEYYLDNIIENLCQMHDIKISAIKYAMSKQQHVYYKPTHLEVGLATKYLDIPVRTAVHLGHTTNKTMYDALEHYIKVDGSFDLEPHFDTEIGIELEKFNRIYSSMFGISQHISKLTEEIYDESIDPYE